MRISRHFFIDFLALLLSRGAAQVLSIIIGLLLVRLMAESAFGAYSLATTSIGLAGVFADFGLDPILTRQAAQNGGSGNRIDGALLRHAIYLRLGLSALVTGTLVGAALFVPGIGRADLLLIGGLGLLPRGAMRVILAVLAGVGRVREAALTEGVTALVASALTVGLVLADFSGDKAAAAIWALTLSSGFGLAAALRGLVGRPDSPILLRAGNGNGNTRRDRAVGALALAAVPMMLVGLAGAVFQSLDVYLVKHFYWQPITPDAVALYAAPFRVLNALLLVPTAWGVVALPRYVQYIRSAGTLRQALRRDLGHGLLGGLLLSATCSLLAEPLTRLALGPAYAPAAPILAVLGWMTLPVCLSAPLIALLTAAGRMWRIARSVALAGLLALIGNIALAESNAGQPLVIALVGVAAIKVGSMGLLVLLYWLSAPRNLLQSHAPDAQKNTEIE